MNELREIFDFGELQIITEKSKLPKYALAKLAYSFARADAENANKRTYPEDILSREINRKSEELRTQKIAGQLEHPFGGLTRLDKVAHVLNAVWYNKNTKLAGAESFVLDTNKGRDFMVMLEAELKMGVSMRGFGNVLNGKIQSDYKFDTVDFVMYPSFGSDAAIDQSNIIESANSILNNDDDTQRQRDLEEAVFDLERESYIRAMEEGFQGTAHDWQKIHGGSLRTMMGIKEDDGKTVVEQLTEQQVKSRMWSHYEEGLRAGFRGDFNAWKEQFPKLVEMASVPTKISEEAPKPKEPFKSRATWEEIQLSGFKGTMEEFEKQCPDISIIKPAPPQKPIKETLEAEAERIYSALKKDTPNSSITLESVRQMLEKEEIVRSDKHIRKRAINIVSRDLAGNVPQATIEKMVAVEIEALKKQRAEMRERNWQAYERLLDE